MIAYLKRRYGEDSVSFDHTKYNPVEFRMLMLNTRILLGVNGGGLASNLFFVSPHAKVIDFMLYDLYGGVDMPWFTSSLRNLEYVRIYVMRRNGYVHININDLQSALDLYDGKRQLNKSD